MRSLTKEDIIQFYEKFLVRLESTTVYALYLSNSMVSLTFIIQRYELQYLLYVIVWRRKQDLAFCLKKQISADQLTFEFPPGFDTGAN